MNDLFHRLSIRASKLLGSSIIFALAIIFVLVWLIGGYVSGFTDSWMILINTICSITTFIIVFLIQNTQNRNSRSMQLKLDELIRAVGKADNSLINLEETSDQTLDEVQSTFRNIKK